MKITINKMLSGIRSMIKRDRTSAYTYELADKKNLQIATNRPQNQERYLSFWITDAEGYQYFATECNESDEIGIRSTVEYICNRFLPPAETTHIRVSVEKKLILSKEFDATKEQMLIIRDGGNPFEREMNSLFDKTSLFRADNDYSIDNLDTGKNLVPWND